MYNFIIYMFVFMMGSIIGSFLNVCIYRIPKKESIAFPPSHCPKCRKNILWHDNIPLLSYIVLLGKCRSCKTKISFRYFLVELVTALVSIALFVYFGMSVKFFAYLVLSYGLIVATFVDFEIQEIPDEVSLGGIVVGLLTAGIFPSLFDAPSRMSALANSGLGLLVGGGSIFIMKTIGTFVFRKRLKDLGMDEAMGDGDIKLMAMIGAFLGWKLVLITFFIAPFFGAVIGIASKIRSGSNIIPYGPYLSLAAMVAMFFGDRILNLFIHGIF